jgi:hypothetical protein
MKFVCEKYPELWIHDLAVRFHDGQVEVTDQKTITALRKLSPELGVREAAKPERD